MSIQADWKVPFPSPIGDCITMDLLRREGVGFQSFRMRVFQVWEPSSARHRMPSYGWRLWIQTVKGCRPESLGSVSFIL